MKTIKKLLTIGLAFLLMFCMSISFSACDTPANSSCEHTYEWVGSEGGHQKVYTCGCEYPDIVELHSDNNSDYVCDVCGWPIDGILPEFVPDGNQNQNDSNDIFYTASYPQDFEYNGRHYHLVQGVGLKTTVTQEELGELLGYIIREEDISAFTQEYPNVNYVIDNGIYDYETKNRVAFYSVKAYPDLSLICMNQLGEYVLFHDITDLLA